AKCTANSPENLKIALCLPVSCAKDQPRLYSFLSEKSNDVVHVCGIECARMKKEKSPFFWLVNSALFCLLSVSLAVSVVDFLAEKKEAIRQEQETSNKHIDYTRHVDIRNTQ
ncbi:hypothetical protein PFISCL1PPCAC_8327, partial [Pristionchus fissidentatus]